MTAAYDYEDYNFGEKRILKATESRLEEYVPDMDVEVYRDAIEPYRGDLKMLSIVSKGIEDIASATRDAEETEEAIDRFYGDEAFAMFCKSVEKPLVTEVNENLQSFFLND